jgi:hypothetical protein
VPKSWSPALLPPLAKCREHSSRASVSATVKARRRIVFALTFTFLVEKDKPDKKAEFDEDDDEEEVEAC